jgi:hypothetical protein
MQRFNLPKLVGASALALSMSLLPLALPGVAQTAPGTGTGTDAAPGTTTGTRDVVRVNDGFDWGWLGLLGLIGLAGLARKDEPTAYREPDVATRSGYRE